MDRPFGLLIATYGIWKAYLLAIAAAAAFAGPAYDTSASLLDAQVGDHAPVLLQRLTSWDAIYFVQSARRGYLFEQEWAFGAGLPLVVATLRQALARLGLGTLSEPLLALAVSHVAHLLSVLLLYRLGLLVWGRDGGRRTAFVAACLHIFSPAGLFLSAPYAESSFSFLSFAGYLVFAAARLRDPSTSAPSVAGDLLRLLAGVLFGVSIVFRSNGLLNGVPFAYEALLTAAAFARQPRLPQLRRLVALGLGGLLVAAGFVAPQVVAYRQFCSAPSSIPGEAFRPWCTRTLPSIYTFVQEHYWNIGLFRYWTLSNIPLFLLAAPMLFVLVRSGLDVWTQLSTKQPIPAKKQDTSTDGPHDVADPRVVPLLQCMTAVQLLLAALAVTSYHVQIITRISSGYPVWYWWLAQSLDGPRAGLANKIVVFMVMYASIQGVLFASFLPPA